MKNKRMRKSDIVIILGGILILSASLLFVYDYYQESRAENTAWDVISAMRSGNDLPRGTGNDMAEVEIDGNRYVGYLSIPGLETEVPVISEWDYERLKIAPCRQFGTARGGDLVIAGHNYRKQFGRLGYLKNDDMIIFTDMDGHVYIYKVRETGVIPSDAVGYVKDSKWDLVLYTCTFTGEKRIMAGAELIREEIKENIT